MTDRELLEKINADLEEIMEWLAPLKQMAAGLTGPKMALMPNAARNAAKQLHDMERAARG